MKMSLLSHINRSVMPNNNTDDMFKRRNCGVFFISGDAL